MFENWVSMETFYYKEMIIEIVIAIVFGIIALATLFNLKNKIAWKNSKLIKFK